MSFHVCSEPCLGKASFLMQGLRKLNKVCAFLVHVGEQDECHHRDGREPRRWLHPAAYSYHYTDRPHLRLLWRSEQCGNVIFEPFIYKNDHFAKTGSGQHRETSFCDAILYLKDESFCQDRLGTSIGNVAKTVYLCRWPGLDRGHSPSRCRNKPPPFAMRTIS